jgi:hypothetical protein
VQRREISSLFCVGQWKGVSWLDWMDGYLECSMVNCLVETESNWVG